MKIYSLFSLLILGCFSANAQEMSATEIIRKADELLQGNSNYAEISMKIHRPKWDRSLTMKSWSKGNDFSLIYIISPAKEKGQVFLKRNNEMWNWLPSIDRTIKIPPSMMMQSWMGSDMTNDDLVNESSVIKDYDHKIVGEEILEGLECYIIELIPHEDAPVVWGKIYSWVSKTKYFALKNEYYDEDDFLVNIETLSNIKNVGDRTIPTKFTIVPVDKEDHYTEMEFVNIKFNIDIEESFFSIQNMKKIR
ncbi:MAG: outer membrane lipoprotein-sorting protein [Bacteroidales bacterium]|nr:outer membrane lipoprotein-sorting protein [Bacteroidales bacterium]MCF8389655.1 outer membrane lipoprotein-sorting protein [Bacteroidales bacterium]